MPGFYTKWIGTRFLLNKYVNGELVSYTAWQASGSYTYVLFDDSDRRIWTSIEYSLVRYVKESDDSDVILDRCIYSALEYKDVCYISGERRHYCNKHD